MVAKDGIEPPTPAFQGRLPDWRSGLESAEVTEGHDLRPWGRGDLGRNYHLYKPRASGRMSERTHLHAMTPLLVTAVTDSDLQSVDTGARLVRGKPAVDCQRRWGG